MHIVELSTAVVKVDIKVTNASLTQNQCLQWVTPPLTHVEINHGQKTTRTKDHRTKDHQDGFSLEKS